MFFSAESKNTKTHVLFNGRLDRETLGTGRPLTANYYWVQESKELLSGDTIYSVFYKNGKPVSLFWRDKEKACKIADKLNNKIAKALKKGKPLPRPSLQSVISLGGSSATSEFKDLFHEYNFERKQKEHGIKRQFEELESPGVHFTAEQLWDEYAKTIPKKELSQEAKTQARETVKHVLEAYRQLNSEEKTAKAAKIESG